MVEALFHQEVHPCPVLPSVVHRACCAIQHVDKWEEFWVVLLDDAEDAFSTACIKHIFEIDEGSNPGGELIVGLWVNDVFLH